jgi:hypothetical protein
VKTDHTPVEQFETIADTPCALPTGDEKPGWPVMNGDER